MLPGQSELSPREVAVAIAGGTIALIVLGIQPLLYGAYVLEGTISAQRLGLLSAVEITGIAGGSALAIQLVARWRTQLTVIGAIALLVAGNLVRIADGDTLLLMASRFVAGLGGGLLVGLAALAIARTRRIGAWAGLFVFTQSLVPYLLMRGFMQYAPEPGSYMVQLVMAGAGALAIVLLPFYAPRMLVQSEQGETTLGHPRGRGLIGLAAVFLCVGAVGGFWGYLEVWMESRGIARIEATALITTSLLGQILGSVIGAAIADGRWAWLRLIFVLGGLLTCVLTWLSWPGSHPIAFAYGAAYAMAAPAFPPIIARLDPLGRALPYGATAQLAGLAIVPTIAGEMLATASLDRVLMGFFFAMLGSLFLVLSQVPHLLKLNRTLPDPRPEKR